MRVALRTDASRRIGTGHLRRCQSVAEALGGEGAACVFVCREHDEISRLAEGTVLWLLHAEGHVPAQGDPSHADWAGCDWERDADETIAALSSDRPDWIVIAHYAF